MRTKAKLEQYNYRVECHQHICDIQYCDILEYHPKVKDKRQNLRGPRTEPCGNPHTRLATPDMTSSISTRCDRLEIYNFKCCSELPVIPTNFSNNDK